MVTIDEEVRRRQHRAAEWIAEAEKHMRAARLLLRQDRLKTLVLFHVQQGMEMGTKALAIASGIPPRELKGKVRHNNLFLLVKVTQLAVESLDGYDLVTKVLRRFRSEGKGYDSAKHIRDVLAVTLPPADQDAMDPQKYAKEAFASALRMSPDEVRHMLDLFDRTVARPIVDSSFERLALQLLRKPIAFRRSPSGVTWTEGIFDQANEQLARRTRRRANPDFSTFLRNLARDMAAQVEEPNWDSLPDAEIRYDGRPLVRTTLGIRDMILANLGLLIVGSLVWGHESYPRYPADEDAPDSIEEAVRKGKLGVKHYTQEMGVICHITAVFQSADQTIHLLKSGYEAGFLLMTAEDVTSQSL